LSIKSCSGVSGCGSVTRTVKRRIALTVSHHKVPWDVLAGPLPGRVVATPEPAGIPESGLGTVAA
jgi:hypothetical protein